MTGCRARCALAALALVVLTEAGPAAGQSGPTPLRPTSPVPMPEPRAPSGFIVEPLKAPDVQGIGVLEVRNGGFGIDMWDGTPAALVARLLPALPARSQSPAVRALMRRLLLSAAAPPQGDARSADPLLQQRVERLWAMGEIDGMLRLIAAVPAAAQTGPLLRYRIDGMLLRGDVAGTCRLVPAGRAEADADGYLSQVWAFCEALVGRRSEAALTASWLRERGFGDPAFFTALDALTGTPGEIASLPQPRPLHLAMARAASIALSAEAAGGDQLPLLAALARYEGASLEARLIAAEKAAYAGALDAEELRRLYSSVTFGDDAANRPIDDAASAAGWQSRALLFRIAQTQKDAAARGELIAKALELAGRHGHFAATARLYAPMIEELPASAELSGFAATAVRALLAAGRRDKVAAWLPFCPADQEAPVWPLLRLVDANEDDPLPAGQLAGWLKQRAVLPPDQARRQAALLFGLLDALGDRVRTEDWLELMDAPPHIATQMPQAALWHGQRIAAEELRLGETVLLALVSLGDGFPAEVDPTAVYRIVASLRLVGFDDEARAIALEAALAAGV